MLSILTNYIAGLPQNQEKRKKKDKSQEKMGVFEKKSEHLI